MKQTIVRHTLNMLRDLGVDLMQGYLFAKPALAALPAPMWPGQEVASRLRM